MTIPCEESQVSNELKDFDKKVGKGKTPVSNYFCKGKNRVNKYWLGFN